MKHKKKHKKEKKRKEKRKKQESSSDSSSEDEWVEKESVVSCEVLPKKGSENDDWLSDPRILSGTTREELREKKVEKQNKEINLLDCPGQSSRELNPYWKDGGTGLPSKDVKATSLSCYVGDGGANWLRKALQRAKEQAILENKSLEEVAAERWGSLENFNVLLEEAKNHEPGKQRNQKYALNKTEPRKLIHDTDKEHSSQKDYRRGESRLRGDSGSRVSRYQDNTRSYEDTDSRCNRKRGEYDERRYKKCDPSHANDNSEHSQKKYSFVKPDDSQDLKYGKKLDREKYEDIIKSSSSYSGGWKKKTLVEDPERKVEQKPEQSSPKVKEDVASDKGLSVEMSEDEMNALGAKIIKAEIMGNASLVAELKGKLEKARAVQAKAEQSKRVVILTKTDGKGFSHPVISGGRVSSDHKRKTKVDTHEGGKRMRYFANDDKFSLEDIYVQEKLSTASDQDEIFARLARKKIGDDESARNLDDVFEETARIDDGEDKLKMRERQKAIKEHSRKEKILDNCKWCLDNKLLLHEAVIAVGDQIYLCVPPFQSLTVGHCLIIPNHHVPCATAVDEDMWTEIMDLKRALVQYYLSQEEDVVFFENAMYLNKHPHMIIHCVPVPKEIGDVAPIYFKKAIMECEMEWSSNKKLIELSGKGCRKAIPKGLSYFCVDFGMQDGYGHIIEDRKLFPNNFAQEIIGGMLDLDHTIWRKQKREETEDVQRKANDFKTQFQPFNPFK